MTEFNMKCVLPTISAVNYELGNKKRDVESIEKFERYFDSLGVPADFITREYKTFYENKRPLIDMLSGALSKTLDSSNVDVTDVDALFISSSNVSSLDFNTSLVVELLARHGLVNALPIFISLQECASSITAVNAASKYLQNPGIKNVVLLTFDLANGDSDRIKQFGLLSDSAASCLISYKNVGMKVVSYSNRMDLEAMKGHEDIKSRANLANRSIDESLGLAKICKDDIKLVFSTNFFNFIADLNALSIRLPIEKIFIDTAAEIGHCLNSDPFINMHHYLSKNRAKDNEYFIMQSYAPGFVANILLRYDI